MKAIIGFCALALSLATAAQAATVNTTLTVNGTAAFNSSDTALNVTGTATLTNIGSGGSTASGTFSATVSLASVGSSATVAVPFTMTFSAGTLTGTVTLPASILLGSATSATGTGVITGGSGSYAGYSGSFPSLSGNGGIGAAGITVTFTGAGTINTTGGGTVAPTPTITAVLDAASYTASIAQGSIFVVKGTNLSASGFSQLGFPLPTSSSGVQIAFTPASGGSPTNAYLVYLYNQGGVNQLAAILPSTLAIGNYNVTVTNSGTVSAPFTVSVVQRKPGVISQDSSGSGLAVIQNYISATELDVDRFTTGAVSGVTISPAKPGQPLIAWATGLGPVTGGDNTASAGFNFEANGANVQVIVGGMSITPVYAGRAPGLAGADQINFTLPANVPTGCTVSFQISVNGVLSTGTFISIAPSASANACVAPGLTTSQLQNLDNGGSLTSGGFELEHFSANIVVPSVGNVTETIASVAGGFTQVTGFQLASYAAVTYQPGACYVTQSAAAGQSTTTTTTVTTSSITYLDAGAVTLNGPSGSNITNAALTESSDIYSLSISLQAAGITIPPAEAGIPNASIVPGTYTLKGAGGKDVGPFNASLTLGSLLTITGGLPASVTRNSGLTLNWTGGNSTDVVEIFGLSGSSSIGTATFGCITTAGAGTFTVPASILNQLPAVTASAITAGTGTGYLGVFSSPAAAGSSLFSAPLTAGGTISNATFLALLGVEATASYQ